MDNQLLTGVVLIAAGLALGLLAYAIVLSRKERGASQEADAPAEKEPASPPPIAAQWNPAPSPAVRAAPPTPAVVSPPAAAPVTPPAPRPAAPSARGANVPVATLERNEVTGELIIRVGEKEYRTSKELRASSDWTRIQYAAGDLQRWMTDVAAADRPRGAPREVATPPARTMIEQINGILARKIAETGVGKQGVRLVDSAGVVQVFLGVERYEMDKVPDEGVRKLIREAVSEWEARP